MAGYERRGNMAGLSGLTPLSAIAQQQRVYDTTPEATPEERYGGPADPRHEDIGERAKPYSWESQMTPGGSHGPYGPENQLLGDESWVLLPGGTSSEDPTFDETPSHRAGPFPKGIASGPVPGMGPEWSAPNRVQSAEIHSVYTGAGLKALHPVQALGIQNDSWSEIWQVDPNSSDLQPIPRQAMSSGFMWGTRDRIQSMARQNQFGFDSRHMHRRYATGPIPGNNMWMRPGGRPLMKNLAGPARPAIGPDSPFAGHDLGAAYSIDGALLQNVPTEYVPPSQPNLASAGTTEPNDSVVEWY